MLVGEVLATWVSPGVVRRLALKSVASDVPLVSACGPTPFGG